MGAIYLPAYLLSRFDPYLKSPNFRSSWNSKGFFKYPYLFTSYGLEGGTRDIRRQYSIDPDVVIFTDSGGFQILSKQYRIDPEKVIEWENGNADIGMTLDVPPYDGPAKKNVLNWEDCMLQTVQNTRIMNDRKSGKLNLYGTIHGLTDNQRDEWKNAIDLVGDLDGYALGLGNDPESVIRMIRYVRDRKIEKPLHFFRLGASLGFFLVSRYSLLYPSMITADSSSFMIKMRGYTMLISPMDIGRTIQVGDKNVESVVNRLGCLCPVCSQTKHIDQREFRELGLSAFHDLYLLIWHYSILNSLAAERPEALRSIFGEGVKWIEALDKIIGIQSGHGLEVYL